MKRPKQLPAVDRNSIKTAAVPAGSDVRPAFWFDSINLQPPECAAGSCFGKTI